MPTSFRKDLEPTPPRYRTPSPPSDAFEPISPITAHGATAGELGLQWNDGTESHHAIKRSHTTFSEDIVDIDDRPHVLGGAMEAFASIALATTSNEPLQFNAPNSPQSINGCHEPSHKRARSERLPSPNWSRKRKDADDRPATSYEQSPEDRRLEAELLLNFAQAAAQLTSVVSADTQAHVDHTFIDSQNAGDTVHKGAVDDNPQDRQECAIEESGKIEDRAKDVDSQDHPHPNNLKDDIPQVSLSYLNGCEVMVPPITVHGAEYPRVLNDHDQPGQTAASPEILDHDMASPIHDTSQSEQDSAPGPQEVPQIPENVSSSDDPRPDAALLVQRDVTPLAPEALIIEVEVAMDATPASNDLPEAAQGEKSLEEEGDARLEGEPIEESTSYETQQLTQESVENESRTIHGALKDKEHTVEAGSNSSSRTLDNVASSLPEISVSWSGNSNASTPDDKPQSQKALAVCAACNFVRNSKGVETENDSTSWISCDACKSWFHFACAGFKNEREVRSVDKFRCRKCRPTHGSTTYVRKSSRAHSAIDYAGLHQGVIKTSDERPEHHYIKPIKEGTINFLPESFARMRPELVTAEYFEKGTGMKEPIIIPACLNPQSSGPTITTREDGGHSIASYLHSSMKGEDARDDWGPDPSESDVVPDNGQDALGMIVPRGLTVRQVAELYGPEEKVEVIDVKSQNGENKKWNMRRWADYYENPNNKVVRNVISLEVSQSRLGRLIRRPQVVRDLDLQDSVWPEDLLAKGEYPRVQFYCLMSVADCFTDFHIDFGGSSVFYHILKGRKTFLFIPPKEKHLKKYEEWCMSPAQNWTFLGDQTKECYRVDLSEGDTMLIPSGWIHAVWTPEDSLVIGGNFLTRMNFGMQLRVAQVEKTTGVARKFRYPHFQKLHWYTALRYLQTDHLPDNVRDMLHAGGSFHRETPAYLEFDSWGENSQAGQENYHARYYSQPELDGLPELMRYLLRTALIDIGNITDGISADTRNAVKKSIPRGHGEPLDIMKSFAAWCAWKRGNEPIPHWAYPDAVLEDLSPDKLSATAMKKLDREAALSAPRRQSLRMQSQQELSQKASSDPQMQCPQSIVSSPDKVKGLSTMLGQYDLALSETPKRPRITSGTGTNSHRKTACESCRKRRRACKHKDQVALSMATHADHAVNMVETQSIDFEEKIRSLNSSIDANMATLFYQPTFDPFNEGPIPSTFSAIELDHEQPFPPRSESQNPTQSQDQLTHPSSPSSPKMMSETPKIDFRICGDSTRSLESVSGNATHARPRTKACNECRKSKRRCIHDAFGNEDPIKVRETAIPRPHARKSNVQDSDKSAKKANLVKPKGTLQGNVQHEGAVTYDPPPEQSSGRMAPVANMIAQPTREEFNATDDSPLPNGIEQRNTAENSSLILDPALFQDTVYQQEPEEQFASSGAVGSSSGQVNGYYQDITTGPLRPAEGQRSPNISSPTQPKARMMPSNVQSGGVILQPAASLVSPPASLHDDGDNSPLTVIPPWTPSRSSSEQSQKHMQERFTPESGPLRRASSTSYGEVAPENPAIPESTRPTSDQMARPRPSSEYAADEESLRLIKELQAQELGLRRRGNATPCISNV